MSKGDFRKISQALARIERKLDRIERKQDIITQRLKRNGKKRKK
jgi:hypothetical protein